jgi:uncharacterized protein YoxC
MYFQLNKPSIPAIRANILIEKLRELPRHDVSISICATGRTGSGKTTLGNRLIGIDYFMPSTGFQDCTDEINLVEFPIGLKYSDLPGVCSDEKLENYNRAALGIKQKDDDDFEVIDTLTLAKYTDNQSCQRQKFSVSHFQETQLKADLIFYLIAPDKQFLSADCAYLKELLKKHTHKVIYIFNLFTDKETGNFLAATEQNITDVTAKIKKVHTSVLGSENPPIIVPVNCWTGEGISELVSLSHQVLGNDKGKIFEQLIQYQQQQTPDKYLDQTKRELVKLFAYTACQKPEGTYTCDQPLHKVCYALYDFLAQLSGQTAQADAHLVEQVNILINQVLANSTNEISQDAISSLEEDIYSIGIGLNYIQGGIGYINENLESRLVEAERAAIEFRDQEIQSIEEELKYHGEKYETLAQDIRSIETEIESHAERAKSLVNDFNSLNENIGYQVSQYNSETERLNSFAADLSNRVNNFNSRMTRYQTRLQAYNSSVNKINASPYRVSQSAIDSLEEERNFLRRESSYLSDENDYLDEQIRKRDNQASQLEDREYNIQSNIRRRDDIERQIDNEESYIERQRNSGIAKLKAIQEEERVIQEQIRQRAEKIKMPEEYVALCQEVINSFAKELSSITERKDFRIDEINLQLKAIASLTEKFQQEEILEREINSFQKEIFACIENMNDFADEINGFVRDIEGSVAKMAINKLTVDVLMRCTTYHFDHTGECEYKESTYNEFGKEGVTFLLTLAHLILSEKEIGSAYHALHESLSKRFGDLNLSHSTENEVRQLLEYRIDSLFDSSFDNAIKHVGL